MTQKPEPTRTQKIAAIISVIILIGGMGTGYLVSQKENRSIDKHGIETSGIVIQVYSQINRGETCEYKFTVDGIEYSGHQSLGKFNINVGDSCKVIYSSKQPKFNKLILE